MAIEGEHARPRSSGTSPPLWAPVRSCSPWGTLEQPHEAFATAARLPKEIRPGNFRLTVRTLPEHQALAYASSLPTLLST